MVIGIPKEVKPQETRVGLTPKWVRLLVEQGHVVYAEKDLGANAGIDDSEYVDAGALITESVNELYQKCEFIVKLKDFIEDEVRNLPFQEGQIIMSYLHLGENDPHPDVVHKLMEKKVTGIALELIRDQQGFRPAIKPMSQIAGQLALIVAAQYSQKCFGGRGVSLTAVGDVKPAKILILGGGSSGRAAIETALSFGAEVVVFQKNGKTFDKLKNDFPDLRLLPWDKNHCEQEMKTADVLINAIYPTIGMKTPLITREMLRSMAPKSVLIDLAGCGIVETWRFTTISDPVFWEENILHYGVDNMPALVPQTACEVFSKSIFQYVTEIANKGFEQACLDNEDLKRGVCFYDGKLVDADVADTHGMAYDELVLK